MTEIVIVSKTKVRDSVCIGAHRLDDFKSLRLNRPGGRFMPADTKLDIGAVWEADLVEGERKPPHNEDVTVTIGKFIGRFEDLEATIRRRAVIWEGTPDNLFQGRLNRSGGGSGYVPAGGPQPTMSTGYWLPAADLHRDDYRDSPKFAYSRPSSVKRAPWVGVAEPPPRIDAGTLVRVSLSGPWGKGDECGCWLQISGVY